MKTKTRQKLIKCIDNLQSLIKGGPGSGPRPGHGHGNGATSHGGKMDLPLMRVGGIGDEKNHSSAREQAHYFSATAASQGGLQSKENTRLMPCLLPDEREMRGMPYTKS